jgi:hypothetical protein
MLTIEVYGIRKEPIHKFETDILGVLREAGLEKKRTMISLIRSETTCSNENKAVYYIRLYSKNTVLLSKATMAFEKSLGNRYFIQAVILANFSTQN